MIRYYVGQKWKGKGTVIGSKEWWQITLITKCTDEDGISRTNARITKISDPLRPNYYNLAITNPENNSILDHWIPLLYDDEEFIKFMSN